MTARLCIAAGGIALLLAVTAACGSDDRAGVLRVAAASSLTEAFTALGEGFEAENEVDVVFDFDASSLLATRIGQGAPVDVFASADEATMTRAARAGDVRAAQPMARNRLAIVVRAGNPEGVRSLVDLARGGLVVVRCAPVSPCGALADAALDRGGVAFGRATYEQNAKAVVARVALGEADAGLAYRTDVRADRRVAGVEVVVDGTTFETEYRIAVTTAADAPELARRWIGLVRSEEGRDVLAGHGFLPA